MIRSGINPLASVVTVPRVVNQLSRALVTNQESISARFLQRGGFRTDPKYETGFGAPT